MSQWKRNGKEKQIIRIEINKIVMMLLPLRLEKIPSSEFDFNFQFLNVKRKTPHWHFIFCSVYFQWCEPRMDPGSSRESKLFVTHLNFNWLSAKSKPLKVAEASSPALLGISLTISFIIIFLTGIQDDHHVKVMIAGSTLRKVKSRSWKKQRHFRLLEDGLTVWYKSRWAGRGHSTCRSYSVLICINACHENV